MRVRVHGRGYISLDSSEGTEDVSLRASVARCIVISSRSVLQSVRVRLVIGEATGGEIGGWCCLKALDVRLLSSC